MTICIGWTDDKASYLIADSVSTTIGTGVQLHANTSTFGERHCQTERRVAQESVLKILRHGDTAAAFSGDSRAARAIFQTYREHSGQEPLKAFRTAWRSNSPFQGCCSALFSYREDGVARLVGFDPDNIEGTGRHFSVIGNISSGANEVIQAWITKVPAAVTEPRDKLNIGLVAAQTESIFNNHMEIGIGGVYAGSWIDDAGFHWFGPTLYILQSGTGSDEAARPDGTPRIVMAGTADDVLYVLNDSHVFPFPLLIVNPDAGATAGLSVESLSDLLARLAMTTNLRTGAIEYVAFVNLLTQATTIARIPGYGETPNLNIGWEGDVLKFHATGELAAAINRTNGARFVFHDYRMGAAAPS